MRGSLPRLTCPALLLGGAAFIAPGSAIAQRGLDATAIQQPSIDTFGLFTIDRAETARKLDLGLRIGFSYANKPLSLSLTDPRGRTAKVPIYDSISTVHLQAHLGIIDRLEVALDLPLHRLSAGEGFGDPQAGSYLYAKQPATNVPTPNATAGDARFALKGQLLANGPVGVAAIVIATLPFGDETAFAGASSHVYEPRLVADLKAGPVVAALNAGFRVHQHRDAFSDPMTGTPVIADGHELVVGAGVAYRAAEQVSLVAELQRMQAVAAPGDRGDSTMGFLVGTELRPTTDVTLQLAGGRSLGEAARASDFRAYASVGASWQGNPATPTAVGGRTRDRDRDGVPDDRDACPDDPEDWDGFDDEDGCPDLDNDKDGIPDDKDKCPNEPEDKDGFQDEDGCPDLDNDGDGIPDDKDRCPNEPEDKDGFQDEDGCPDLDNDGDGIPDDKDKCPNEPETKNGIDDEDGCPDSGSTDDSAQRVVDFAGGGASLSESAKAQLDELAVRLRANAALRIRIDGHADARGGKVTPQRLSEQRAQAVRAYLTTRGVADDRMAAAGFGARRPQVTKGTRAERRRNDRVEITIVGGAQ